MNGLQTIVDMNAIEAKRIRQEKNKERRERLAQLRTQQITEIALPWRAHEDGDAVGDRTDHNIYDANGVCVVCLTAMGTYSPELIQKHKEAIIGAVNGLAWRGDR